MVPIADIREQNTKFAAQKQTNKVCVFVGATRGIGESTLKILCTLLVAPTIYVVGRSASRWETQHESLRQMNSEARFVFVQADVSTIRGVDQACEQILATASKIDYLCMSAGYFPLVGAMETPEGLEQCFTLSYYSRIRFIHNLLPSLHRSPRPQIMSVFAAGHETTLREDEMGLTRNWSITNFAHQATTMKTLAFHYISTRNPNLALIHTWPGFVLTDPERKPKPDASANFLWRWGFALLRWLGRWVMWLRAIPVEESGQRHAFLLTSEGIGAGVWRFDEFCEESPRSEALEKGCREGKQELVWEFTVGVWERALRSWEV